MSSAGLSPYKGLAPFDGSEHDVQFFFGRDHDREIIAANLMASNLTVLYGETGVGKSSVLRAGVAHHLKELARQNVEEHGAPEVAVVVFDAWRDDPVSGLADAVADAVRDARGGPAMELPTRPGSLADHLHDWAEVLDGSLYVVLDGFEEYFLYHEGEEGAGTFLDEFPEAVRRSGLRASFLVALREDALARLDRFKASIPNLFGNYLRLEHLDRPAAREAIVCPIEQYNRLVDESERVEIEPSLVETVLIEVAAGRVDLGVTGRGVVESADDDEGRVETPYLQLVMQRLWDTEREAGSRVLRLATFRQLGGAEQIVRDHLALALESLGPHEQDLAAEAFEHLVTPSGTKIAHAASDLARYAGVAEQEVQPVLSALRQERVLRTVASDGGGPRYEIYHDVLAEAVLAWRTAHETERELARQRSAAERRHRRLLAVVGGAVLLMLVMAGVTVYALTQRSTARTQARHAGARALEASALSQLGVDPELSLLLAVEAATREPGPRAEDVLRRSLLGSRERAIFRTEGPVAIAGFSPDGDRVLVAGEGGDVRVIDLRTGSTVLALANRKPITSGGLSADGRLILTAGNDGVRIWSARNGRLLDVLRVGAPVRTALFDHSGRRVAVTSGHTVTVSRVPGGERVFHSRLPWPVTGAVFSRPDGRFVAVFGNDGSVLLYGTESGKLVRTFDHGSFVRDAVFSPDGTLLVTTGDNALARVWDVATGRKNADLVGHAGAVIKAAFSPDGTRIATVSLDGSGRIWSSTGALIAPLEGHQHFATDVAFSPDGTLLATASSDRTARVWTVDGEPVALLAGHSDGVTGVTFSPDSRSVLTASDDGSARIWDPRTQPKFAILAKGHGALRSASYTEGGRAILTAGPGDEAQFVRPADGARIAALRVRGAVTAAAATPSGSRIAVAAGRHVTVFDRDGRTIRRLSQPASVTAVAVSSDGESLAAGGSDALGRVWTAARNAPIVLRGHTSSITDIAFGRDGSVIATASSDHTARLWDARTGARLRVLRLHRNDVSSVAFSPGGRVLLTASKDADARLWEVSTGSPEQLLRWHFGPANDASFSPDGRWIATAGPNTVQLWQPGVQAPLLPRGIAAPERPASATFDSTSRIILAAGSKDGALLTYRCGLCGGLDELTALAKARLALTGRTLSPEERRRYGG
jgi:WD40 repeat protein